MNDDSRNPASPDPQAVPPNMQAARLQALQQVVLGLTSTLELEEVLQRVAAMTQRVAGAAHAHIYLYNPDRDELTLVARQWEPGRTLAPPPPRRTGITYGVAHSGKPQFVEDAFTDLFYANAPANVRPGALACLPLLKGERVLGTLNLGFWEPRPFDPGMRDLLDLMARHAAIAIDNAQLYAASQHRARELSALYEISLEINGELDLQQLLEDIVKRSVELLRAAAGYVFIYDPERQMLTLFAHKGLDEKYTQRELRLGEGISGRAAQARRAIALADYPLWPDRAANFSDVPFGAILAAPLLWQDNLLGVIGVAMTAEDARIFKEDEIRLIEQLAAQAAIAIQNARLYNKTREHERELDRRVQEMALVDEISHHVNRLDLKEVQESALDQVVARFGAVYGALGSYDPTTETVTVTAVRPATDPLLGTVLSVENNWELGQAIQLRHAVVWRDDPNMVSDHPTRNYFRRRGTSQLVLAPLLFKDRVIGFMGVDPGEREIKQDEVNLLQTVANQIAIAMENARLAQLAIDKARIEQELSLARSVQASYLVPEGPSLPGWNLCACWRPANEVSGDFYDFIPLPDGRLGIVIGDVTGKGMPAALVMATSRAVIRAMTSGGDPPGVVLERVNDLLCADMPPNMFVTCFYAILTPTTGEFVFANAGQNLPCLRTGREVVKLHATGMPLGLMPGMPYEQERTTIAPGQLVLFYSDGLIEAHNERREMFGFPRLADLVHAEPEPNRLSDRILRALQEFTGSDQAQEDDVTLVTLSRIQSTY